MDTKRLSSRKRHTRQGGQSLVETAIVFPILILLLVAVVDFGRVFDAYIVLTNAAREGARFGSVNPALSEAEVKAFVVEDVLGSGTNLTLMSDFTGANVTVEGQDEGSTEVRVTVTYRFPLWFGRLIGVSEVTLTKDSVMPRWRSK